MEFKTNIFDRATHFITSIKAVILAMSFLLIFLMIETTTLFVRQLLEDLPLFWRVIASIAIAFAFEFTVLIFTANSDHSSKGLKPQHVLAVFHFLINTYFWQVFEFVDWVDTGYKLFLSFLFPYLTFHYAALFDKKFREKKCNDLLIMEELRQKQEAFKLANDQLEATCDELRSGKDELKRRYEALLRSQTAQSKELMEVKRKLSRKGIAMNNRRGVLEKSG
ncbi:MAG: hypothetical protein ACFCUU_14430 [Cyclobacteriaceae bacterium]